MLFGSLPDAAAPFYVTNIKAQLSFPNIKINKIFITITPRAYIYSVSLIDTL